MWFVVCGGQCRGSGSVQYLLHGWWLEPWQWRWRRQTPCQWSSGPAEGSRGREKRERVSAWEKSPKKNKSVKEEVRETPIYFPTQVNSTDRKGRKEEDVYSEQTQRESASGGVWLAFSFAYGYRITITTIKKCHELNGKQTKKNNKRQKTVAKPTVGLQVFQIRGKFIFWE